MTPDPFVVLPSDDAFNTVGLPEEGSLDLLSFLRPGSFLPEADPISTSTFPPLHPTAPGLDFDFGTVPPIPNETFDWDTPNSAIGNTFDPLIQSPYTREEAVTTFLPQEEKAKKLKLLADVREFQQRLEAEIAAMS